MQKDLVIWWLKKDFRLHDNPALTEALASSDNVLALYIVEPSELSAPETSEFHVAAWIQACAALRTELQGYGADLLVIHGNAVETLNQIFSITPFTTLFSHEEIGVQRTYSRDLDVAGWCLRNDIDWVELPQTGVFRALHNRDHRARLWNEWMFCGPLAKPASELLTHLKIPPPLRHLELNDFSLENFGYSLSSRQQRQRQNVSEQDAAETLSDFLEDRSLSYRGGISSPNTASTAGSRLSVHLAWGTITARTVFATSQQRLQTLKSSTHTDANRFQRSIKLFEARLHWRDHFMQRLESEPAMELTPLNAAYEKLPTTDDNTLLQTWVNGETGFPLVDACIRSAHTTGFLNFRMRSMITSVACHAMRLDWRDIMWPMAQWWADYEPGIHLSQIQMQAGVAGINTLRAYNPAKQIIDQDPKTHFIKHWIPELRKYSPEEIVAHQEQPLDEYISPVVDWKESTKAMKADYFALRQQPETRALAQKVFVKHGSRRFPVRKKTTSKNKTKNKQNDTKQLQLPI